MDAVSLHLQAGWDLLDVDKLEEAEAAFTRCCAIYPEDSDVWFSLGVARHQLGKRESALLAFEQALRFDPENVQAYNAKASMLVHLGKPVDAFNALMRALRVQPNNAKTLANIGVLLFQGDSFLQALDYLDRALEIDQGHLDALVNRGVILCALGRLEAAAENNGKLIQLYPRLADGYLSQALVYINLGRYSEALEYCRKASELETDNDVPVLLLRGVVFSAMRLFEDAKAQLDLAMARDRERCRKYVRTLYLGGWCLESRLDPVLVYLLAGALRRACCDWNDDAVYTETLQQVLESGVEGYDDEALILPSLTLPDSSMVQRQCSRVSGRLATHAGATPSFEHQRHFPDKIKLAYLSASRDDFPATVRAVLKCHDRGMFEVFSYGVERDADGSDRHFDLSRVSAQEVAKHIYNDHIHILVDLSGYASATAPRILSYQAAPVQVDYLGLPVYMNAPFVQYRITDPWVSSGNQPAISEKLVYLPFSMFLAEPGAFDQEIITREAVGLAKDALVFCCFNCGSSITPPIFDLWLRFLKQVARGVLWLLSGNEVMISNLRRRAVASGVAPQRLIFLSPQGQSPDLSPYLALADIYLDTPHYSEAANIAAALNCRLPVLTLVGDAPAGRAGLSLLSAFDLLNLTVENFQEYEERALFLAAHREYLNILRRKLGRVRHKLPLFGAERKARMLERAYATMLQRYAQGLEPAAFNVEEETIDEAAKLSG